MLQHPARLIGSLSWADYPCSSKITAPNDTAELFVYFFKNLLKSTWKTYIQS